MSDAAPEIALGSIFEFDYPFVRDIVTLFDVDGATAALTWRPGTRNVFVYPDSYDQIFDATGKQIATVIDVHRPGKFPTRVFWTRAWRDPAGMGFGRASKLRITTMQAFRMTICGFRHAADIRPATEKEIAAHLADLRKQMQGETI